MITEIQNLEITIKKTHTIFIPIINKNMFEECKHILLNLTQQRACFYINTQSVCGGQKGAAFIINTNSLIDLKENEEPLIEDIQNMCQYIANTIKRTVYYQVRTIKNTTKLFKISPEMQCHIQ